MKCGIGHRCGRIEPPGRTRIELHGIEQAIDTSTMEGRAMFGMLSVLAELIVANTNGGLAAARARGRIGGRRPRLTTDQVALARRLYDERPAAATRHSSPHPHGLNNHLLGAGHLLQWRQVPVPARDLPGRTVRGDAPAPLPGSVGQDDDLA
ncbi:hypothetical protein ACQEU3_39500 [Spirillospora sp. CA-253888]